MPRFANGSFRDEKIATSCDLVRRSVMPDLNELLDQMLPSVLVVLTTAAFMVAERIWPGRLYRRTYRDTTEFEACGFPGDAERRLGAMPLFQDVYESDRPSVTTTEQQQ